MRQKILVRGPILTQSGYGEQSRFALRALRSREDLFEIFISENDVIYLCGEISDTNQDSYVVVSIFGLEPQFLGIPLGTLITTITASSVLVVTIILWQVKRRRT